MQIICMYNIGGLHLLVAEDDYCVAKLVITASVASVNIAVVKNEVFKVILNWQDHEYRT